MPQTRVTSTGQISLPKTILRYLNLNPGDRVEFDRTADGRVVLKKVWVHEPKPLIQPSAKSVLKNMQVDVEHSAEPKPKRTDD